ncbi:tetraacyldisaccharide 4'-kinase [Edaphocola aurantiacus]|uniref:tetraacyldisaccharide 4'-kinase n=1 Tax=Edaphocola aurantiacus TaxID=2601682 RepID=UPI001C95A59A|nr:tetraacyldisaccharide 4'-kinase [Edaphocola aurantiacus]
MNLNPLMIFVSVLKLLLYPFSLLYGAIMWLRNRLYDTGIYSSVQFSVPVISVGNLSTGGTGKTPHIEYLMRLLRYEYLVATQSRGYKRRSRGFKLADESTTAYEIGDEPMQFKLKFPEMSVSVCEERMTGIPALLAERPETEVILLDDAYQHRSVKAGLNILITDYSRPFYTDYVLPFGNLREGRRAAKRAHVIIVSKCPPDLPAAERKAITERINPLPHQKVFFTHIRYGTCFDFFTGNPVSLQKEQHIILVSGIARPEPMLHHLREQVADVHLLRYPDHHYFTTANLEEIKQTCKNWEAKQPVIITTEKDATRLALHRDTLQAWGVPVWVLPIEIDFIEGKEQFDQIVLEYIVDTRMSFYAAMENF